MGHICLTSIKLYRVCHLVPSCRARPLTTFAEVCFTSLILWHHDVNRMSDFLLFFKVSNYTVLGLLLPLTPETNTSLTIPCSSLTIRTKAACVNHLIYYRVQIWIPIRIILEEDQTTGIILPVQCFSYVRGQTNKQTHPNALPSHSPPGARVIRSK